MDRPGERPDLEENPIPRGTANEERFFTTLRMTGKCPVSEPKAVIRVNGPHDATRRNDMEPEQGHYEHHCLAWNNRRVSRSDVDARATVRRPALQAEPSTFEHRFTKAKADAPLIVAVARRANRFARRTNVGIGNRPFSLLGQETVDRLDPRPVQREEPRGHVAMTVIAKDSSTFTAFDWQWR